MGYAYNRFNLLLKFYWHILETGRHKEQSCDLFLTAGKQNFMISEIFQAYVGELSILFHDKFLDSKIWKFLP